ncbi:hypothetical protein [Stutzerimonas stutzeri]|uniref:hypothetical protein n=1 Tax=Stutzerimonas stutzeri TaxID=316 RepID=UPI0005EAFD67|nr:hypothetical protein [Stutzerimonas stutzeri]
MKIRTEHQTLGAALMQIAEDENFTAINPLKLKGAKINNAFLINADTCVFLKYGQEPKQTGEYQFTYTSEHLGSIDAAAEHYRKVFVGLVCVEDQEICCLDLDQLRSLIAARRVSHGAEEEAYQVLVVVPEGKSLRAYTNASGRKGLTAGKKVVVARNRFPSGLFG